MLDVLSCVVCCRAWYVDVMLEQQMGMCEKLTTYKSNIKENGGLPIESTCVYMCVWFFLTSYCPPYNEMVAPSVWWSIVCDGVYL